MIKFAIENEELGIDVEEVVEKLSNHVKKSELVSMETFLNKARGLGLAKLSEDVLLKRRILHLYTLANLDDRLVAPGISDLDSNCVFRPFDHNVFWMVFSKLFGKKTSLLLSTKTDREIVYMIKELNDSDVWTSFRSVYFSVLSEANLSMKGEEKKLLKRIRKVSGYQDANVLRKLWKGHKSDLVATVVLVKRP